MNVTKTYMHGILKFTLLIVLVASVPLAIRSGCFLSDGVSLSSPSPGRENRMFNDQLLLLSSVAFNRPGMILG